MRKINIGGVLDPLTFAVTVQIRVRNEDSTISKLTTIVDKYPTEHQDIVLVVNDCFTSTNMSPLTKEEIFFLLNPTISTEEPNEDEIQTLAGFKVEKKIIYKKA
jgi:hypothetical protein